MRLWGTHLFPDVKFCVLYDKTVREGLWLIAQNCFPRPQGRIFFSIWEMHVCCCCTGPSFEQYVRMHQCFSVADCVWTIWIENVRREVSASCAVQNCNQTHSASNVKTSRVAWFLQQNLLILETSFQHEPLLFQALAWSLKIKKITKLQNKDS